MYLHHDIYCSTSGYLREQGAHFNMQGEDVMQHANGKVSCVDILVCRRKKFLSILMSNVILVCKRKKFLNILMPSVVCAHFSQLLDHCVTI